MLALTHATLFTGTEYLREHAVVIEGSRIAAVLPNAQVPPTTPSVNLSGLLVAPGFVDVQVNGGGGVLYNDRPAVETIETMRAAHLRFGTTALLPTFITGPATGMQAAVRAVETYQAQSLPGVLGVHLEGPFLDPHKAGVHDRTYIRRPEESDLVALEAAQVPVLLTVAPETVPPAAIARLVAAGVRVSLGHSNCTYEVAMAAFEAGATKVTHLYNAMSPLLSRAPGLVGAALDHPKVWTGVIADGHHVSFPSLRVAIRAKGPDKTILVTDAMPPVGSPEQRFQLGGDRIVVENGVCVRQQDGVLAGSALDMATAVRNCVKEMGFSHAEALRMASTNPATFLGLEQELGHVRAGHFADLVVLDEGLQARATVVRGHYAPSPVSLGA